MNTRSAVSGPERPPVHPLVRTAYMPRVVSWGLAALIVVSTPAGRSLPVAAAALTIGFGWPHLAYRLGRRAADQRGSGLRHLLVDGFLAGLFMGLCGFSPLPAGAMALMAMGFQLMMAGPSQLLRGAAAAAAGMAVSLPLVGFHPVYQPGLTTINLCLAFFGAAFWSSAYLVNRTTRDLVRTRGGLREANRRMADQARCLELAVAESIEINEVARTVNAALGVDDVLERVLQSLHKVFDFDQAGTLTIDRDREVLILDRFVGSGAAGEVEDRLRAGAIPLAAAGSIFVRALGLDGPHCIADITESSAAVMHPADLAFWELNPMRSVVICPLEIRDEVIGLLCLGSRSRACPLGDRELMTVERYVTHVATAIWSARLFEEAQRARRLAERELEIGREIQAEFLPESLPAMDGWEMSARLHSARQVSGDFYDAFVLDDARVVLVVADVCDKGVGAALYMALFRSLLRAAADAPDTGAAQFPSRALRQANDYIADTHDRSNMFATVFIAVVDPDTGELEYANGGHEPPAVLRRSGGIERLEPTGPAVGLMAGSTFRTRRLGLALGDTLLAFTDGVTEARDPAGGLFGEDRLLEAVETVDGPVAAVLDRLEAALDRHADGGPRADDVTLLAIRRIAVAARSVPRFQRGAA